MNNNKQRTLMMDSALTFIINQGRDVQEAAVRKHLKKHFPMTNEREQSVWILTTFRNLEEMKAIQRAGVLVGVTKRGRRIMRCGGTDMYERMGALADFLVPAFKALSVVVAMTGTYFTAKDVERTTFQIIFLVSVIIMSVGSIYSLMRTRKGHKVGTRK